MVGMTTTEVTIFGGTITATIFALPNLCLTPTLKHMDRKYFLLSRAG